jgi:hypothetical protein
MENDIGFVRRLIKGKIIELIFEMMMRDAGNLTVLRGGYEYTHPELAQYQQLLKGKGREALKFFEHNPDFLLFTEDKSSLFLVEVKYYRHIDYQKMQELASDTFNRWRYIWLFVATPEGFFFSPCKSISEGSPIQPLSYNRVTKELQEKYLRLLHEFLPQEEKA